MPILSSFGGLSAIGRGARAGGRLRKTITVTGNIDNFDVWANRNASQHGASVTVSPEPYEPGNTDFIITINSGVLVGSVSTGSFALTVSSSFSSGDSVSISNGGNIRARGGAAGQAGGTAVHVQRPISFENSGEVSSGGGGGGTGATAYSYCYNPLDPEIPCYGPCGCRTFAGGLGGVGAGAQGSSTSGSPPAASDWSCMGAQGGYGGAGGAYDSNGSNGNAAIYGGCYSTSPTSGGPKGACTSSGSKAYINSGAGIPGTTYGVQN